MTTRTIRTLITIGMLCLFIPISSGAQLQSDVVPLGPWPAPLYWQLSEAENQIIAKPDPFGNEVALDTGPANSLVFVGMTPCRVVDTRPGSGFAGAFGQPNLVGNAIRTFPIQSSATCSIPSIAKAYSFNVTIVPFGFLDYITVWPTGQARPNASTLNGYVNTVIANAAIVPAGTSGSVDVYASQTTHLIIDINGYYAQQSGIALAQGTAGAPSLSFAGDPQTGIFSSGTGALNISAKVGIGTTTPPAHALQVNGITSLGAPGSIYAQLINDASPGPYPTLGFNSFYNGSSYLAGVPGYGGVLQFHDGDGKFGLYSTGTSVAAGAPHTFIPRLVVLNNGNVGIGTPTPAGVRLHVDGGTDDAFFASSSGGGTAVVGISSTASGVWGSSTSSYGVRGSSSTGLGVAGSSGGSAAGVRGTNSGTGPGVHGVNNDGYAGFFEGRAKVTKIPLLASAAAVCFNAAGDLLQCGASSLRWKTNVTPFNDGLDIIRQLRPIRFNWKEDGRPDIGLGAEDVAKVAPSLAFTNSEGEVEGVKYEKLNLLLINSIQQQQAQIEEQQAQIEDQKRRIIQQQEQILQQQQQTRTLEERFAALERLLSTNVQSTAGNQ